MGGQRFTTGTRFIWQEVVFEVSRVFGNGQLNIIDTQTGEVSLATTTQLAHYLFNEQLAFISDPAHTHIKPSPPIDLSDYPSDLQKIAQFRLMVIQPLLQKSKRTKRDIHERITTIRSSNLPHNYALSESSVYRWIRHYRESGHDIRSLIPGYKQRGGLGQSRLATAVDTIIQRVIEELFLVRERVTIDDLLHEVAVRIDEENQYRHASEKLQLPSQRTISRRVDELDIQKRLKAKHGRQKARQMLTQFGQTDYPQQPLERVEIDHTKLDVIVVDGIDKLPLGRPTITYALDTATRYPLGYYVGFEPPSYLTVMQCLYHAIIPKSGIQETYQTAHEWIAFGLPMQLVIDNGKEFVGRDLADACRSLGIEIERTPARTPWLKAAVERAFGTLNTGVIHRLTGTTFSNPAERDEYDSMATASLTLADLDHILTLFFIDVYAERYHSGLNGVPARRWEEALANGFSPRLPASHQELHILLGRVAYRVIHSYGIELHVLRYNSPELAPLRLRLSKQSDKRVKIKWSPADLGQIHVYHPIERRYITIPALAEEYANGLTLWQHRVIRQRVLQEKGEVDLVALGQAKRKIQSIIDESKERTTGSRSKIARWESADQTKETQTTPQPLDIDLNDLDETNDNWSISHG